MTKAYFKWLFDRKQWMWWMIFGLGATSTILNYEKWWWPFIALMWAFVASLWHCLSDLWQGNSNDWRDLYYREAESKEVYAQSVHNLTNRLLNRQNPQDS